MKNDIFDISNFNVIEDDNFYYYFRALESYDIKDINDGKVDSTSSGYSFLRTCRERYNETHSTPSRYSEDEDISLDQIYSHIKKNYYTGTNCISFSSNANVSLDYGGSVDKYVMMRVPKAGLNNVYNAGQYMLMELDKYLDSVIREVRDTNVFNEYYKIGSFKKSDDLIKFVYDCCNKDGKIKIADDIRVRFNKKQFFNEEQQLEYNKVIGRLTILESFGLVKNVLSRTNGNSSLIATIGMAYSSGEVIHYGNDFSSELKSVPKSIMYMFSILQQAEDMGYDKVKVKQLKQRVLEYALKGYDLKTVNGDVVFSNGVDDVKVSLLNDTSLLNDSKYDINKELSVDEVFKLTKGMIPFAKTKSAVSYALNLALAKEKTADLCKVLSAISHDLKVDDLIDEISHSCYAINEKLISRQNNSGMKICESVNLDMNSSGKLFDFKEQENMFNYINSLNQNFLDDLLKTSGAGFEKNVCSSILNAGEITNVNSYYADTIVANIDFDKVYANGRVISIVEKKKLLSKLNDINCVNLYKTLKNMDFSDTVISNIVVNLLIDNGIGGISLKNLAVADNLNDLLINNKEHLKLKLHPIRLDRLFDIRDNINDVYGTSLKLRDYQKDAFDNIQTNFETKKFSGVILPTGAGKSFVAMAEMLEYKDKNILYYAPNTEILNQIARHILKNICGLSKEEIEKLYEAKDTVPNGKFLPANIQAVISTKIKNIDFYCYQGLSNKDDEFFRTRNADLIIFDEIHRTGATKWGAKIKEMLELNPNAKILGITATPVRDVDSEDMMRRFAEISGDYSSKEIEEKRYLASELYLVDAMQEGLVVIPNLVSFDYNLDLSSEFLEVESLYNTETLPEEKERLGVIYNSMRDIVENSKATDISQIFYDSFIKNNKRKNGKYIVFLPYNNDPNISSEEFIKSEIEKVKEYFSLIYTDPQIGYLLSNREKTKENHITMRNFEKDNEHLQLIFAIDMLNEGVHVDGIDGIVMLRPIKAGSKILYNQQLGRCIYGLSPDNPHPTDVPLVFDVYNNYLSQNMDREVNKTNSTSDLQRLKLAIYWINKHKGLFPDINSEDVLEYRKALFLKRIQMKYSKYLDNSLLDKLSLEEKIEVEQIMDLCNEIELWDIDIPDRTAELTSEFENVTRNNAFRATGEVKRFLELFKESKTGKITKVQVGAIRIRNAISVLELLHEYGIRINNFTIYSDVKLGDIVTNLPSDVLGLINSELDNLGIDYDYNLFNEYNYIKQMFYLKNPIFLNYDLFDLNKIGLFEPHLDSKNKSVCSVDKDGFIIKGPVEYLYLNINTGTLYNLDGYDYQGLDELGFKFGAEYNEYGFDRRGIHKDTHTLFDKNNFDINGNYYKLYEYGQSILIGRYNDHGFDAKGYWYKKVTDDSTGEVKYIATGKMVDDEGFNINGVNSRNFNRFKKYIPHINSEHDWYRDKYGFNFEGFYEYTKSRYNSYNFDCFGNHINGTKYDDYGFNIDGIHIDTGYEYDTRGFGRNGLHRKTRTFIDGKDEGFDRDGVFWIRNNQGELEKYGKYNRRGFDFHGINNKTGKHFDYFGKDYKGDKVKGLPSSFVDLAGETWVLIQNDFYNKVINKESNVGQLSNAVELKTPELDDYNFDNQGYFWDYDDNGVLVCTGQKVNEDGFNKAHIYEKTGKPFNEFGRDINHRLFEPLINGIYFDRQGCYWEIDGNGKAINTQKKYNKKYFGKDKKNVVTNQLWDEYGFDIDGNFIIEDYNYFSKDGFFWELLDNGKYFKTDRFYNNEGFDRRHIHYLTGKVYNENGVEYDGSTKTLDKKRGFDDDGFFWEKLPNGNYKKTDKKINQRNFDKKGYYCEIGADGELIVTSSKFDPFGFNKDGLYKMHICGRVHYFIYDPNDFDVNGVHKNGTMFNDRGFNRYKQHRNGTQYDEHGFDFDGGYLDGGLYDSKGFDFNHNHKDTGEEFDLTGRNYLNEFIGINYETRGFDKNCIHQNGTRYDDYGFDVDGVYIDGTMFDSLGFDYKHIHKDTGTEVDKDGFDRNGGFWYGDYGYGEARVCNPKGFDRDGYFYKKDDNGHFVKTDSAVDELGFDTNGVYYERDKDGNVVSDGQKINADGIDRYGFNREGICVFTNLEYDKRGFNNEGINLYTGTIYDFNGFDRDGIHQHTGRYCNNIGFDCFGINIKTMTYVDENGRNIYRNIQSDLDNPKKYSNELKIVKKYIDEKYLLKSVPKDFYKEVAKLYGLTKVSECDKKINELMFKVLLVHPELKSTLVRQTVSLISLIESKKQEVEQIKSENKKMSAALTMKIEELQKNIDSLESRVSKISINGR